MFLSKYILLNNVCTCYVLKLLDLNHVMEIFHVVKKNHEYNIFLEKDIFLEESLIQFKDQ